MLQRDEHYAYVSSGSDFEVTKVGTGSIKVIIDGAVIEETENLNIWKRNDSGEFMSLSERSQSTHILVRTRRTLADGTIVGTYHSDGKPGPALYKGVGKIELYQNGNLLATRLGFVFYIHTVAICLPELVAKNLIHPASVWA